MGKKLIVIRYTTFFVATNNKIVNYLIFEQVKNKIRANLQRIIVLCTWKIVIKLLKNMGLGSGIRIRNTALT